MTRHGAGQAAGHGPPGEPADGEALAVDVVELEMVRVAVVRSLVAAEDVPDFMSDALPMVAQAVQQAGLAPAGPPFARYFSVGADGLDIAVGFPVAEPFLGAGVVRPDELPAGPAAVATYVGPHAGLAAAWATIRLRIAELRRVRGEAPWEVYFIGPGSGADEAEWRTELVWPLEPETGVSSAEAPPAP